MSYLKHFLTDDKNTPSSMRLMALIALFAGIYIAITTQNVELTSVFVVAAFTGKVAQKFGE